MPEAEFNRLIAQINERYSEFLPDEAAGSCYINVASDPHCKKRLLGGGLRGGNLDSLFSTAVVIRMESDGLARTPKRTDAEMEERGLQAAAACAGQG